MGKKSVSVVIPVYNAEKYIGECLNSIISQTLHGIEIICVIDGSPDRSKEIIDKYLERGNIVIIQQDNMGAGPSRNRGIREAEGEYVCFMDPDDFYANFYILEKMYRILNNSQYDVCGANIRMVFPDGKEKSFGDFEDNGIYNGRVIAEKREHCRYMYRKSFLLENNLFYPPYRRFQDPPFMFRVASKVNKFYAITDTMYMYRVGYKEVVASENNVVDVLSGILDCYNTAISNDLREIAEQSMESWYNDVLLMGYSYFLDGNESVLRLLDEIEKIWGDNNKHLQVFNKSSLKMFFEDILSLAKWIKQRKKIVIYGAGSIAERFICSGSFDLSLIEGIAVSNLNIALNEVGGFIIRDISSYFPIKDNIKIVICANDSNSKDMSQNLERLGCNDFFVMNGIKIRIFSKMLDDDYKLKRNGII